MATALNGSSLQLPGSLAPENASPSLKERAADSWPLSHQNAAWGPRVRSQPLPLPGLWDVARGCLQAAPLRLCFSQLRKPLLLPRLCASSFHLCTQSPASLQAIPRTNRLLAIFSRSHCHCLGSSQGSIFLTFFPNPNEGKKERHYPPRSLFKPMCQVLN